MMRFESTKDIPIPKDPLQQIIGQRHAVQIARIAAKQRRNLLLVGPPGIGKSLLAQAISYHLEPPSQEVSVLHNPETPERPLVEVKSREQLAKERRMSQQIQGRAVTPKDVPSFVAERLGFRCRRCGKLSESHERACPACGVDKYAASFGQGVLSEYVQDVKPQNRVHTTRLLDDGREEVVVYERHGEKIRVLDQRALEKLDQLKKKKPRKVLMPFNRQSFVIATGASETELLGDVRHDPYGGHAGVGVQPYLRVVPGSVHEAHEGVLFVDELSALGGIQRFLLTAMQERKYSIVGRNPHSAGASVRVESVPCDFILVAASNINDLPNVLPPLRSRVVGNGYEVLLDTTMPDTEENRDQLCQFVAQEIVKDGKIPHASADAVDALLDESRRRARRVDESENALTLRLRELSGVIRLAGDLACAQGTELISAEQISGAIHRSRNIEEQLREKYGSVWKASAKEFQTHLEERSAQDSRDVG
ncbi:AAA family ATPase [Candidatus Micrarchaeota archaeon]|nr:AAA family ATPase [Candidatus Micrarchaeota archaeon]